MRPSRKPSLAQLLRAAPNEPKAASTTEAVGFPPWAVSSIVQWLLPFFRNEGVQGMDFIRAVERNLRITLDWSHDERSALATIQRRMSADGAFFVALVDFALHNILVGYDWDYENAAAASLDRILYESGADWRVRAVADSNDEYFLERRTDPASDRAVAAFTTGQGPEAQHLSDAWNQAYGQSPNPGDAYRNAVKAVEDVAIPVVLPNDKQATLGKVIAALRNDPSKWTCVFARAVGSPSVQRTPVEVVIDMLDMLWKNQTDRHGSGQAPILITQAQAELAVNVALALVPIFRDQAIS